MKPEVQKLLDEAKTIALKNKRTVGTRYPQKIKKIVYTLVNTHNMSYSDISSFVPVSKCSIQAWSTDKSKKRARSFHKVTVKKEKTQIKSTELHLMVLALQALLLSAQLFLD